jgi:2-methylcitrate dehydratase PrpD
VDRPRVTNGLEAKFSIQYTLAAALTDGAISLRHFTDAAIARPDVKGMLSRVTAIGVESGDALSQACELTVKLKAGATRSVRRDDAEGRTADEYPIYMKTKFFDCVEQVFDRSYAEDLLPQLISFDSCLNVDRVLSRLARTERADKVRMVQS